MITHKVQSSYEMAVVLSNQTQPLVETIWLEKTNKPHYFIVRSSPLYTHGINYMDTVVAIKIKRTNKNILKKYNIVQMKDYPRVQSVKEHGGYMTLWLNRNEIGSINLEEIFSTYRESDQFITTEFENKRISCAVHIDVYAKIATEMNRRCILYHLPDIEFDESI